MRHVNPGKVTRSHRDTLTPRSDPVIIDLADGKPAEAEPPQKPP